MPASGYGKSNLLQAHSRDPWLVTVSGFFMISTLLTPVAVTVDVVSGRFSPLFLNHQLADVSEKGELGLDATNPTVWALGFMDWILVNAGVFYVFCTLAFAFETMIQTSLALRTLRYS